MPPAKSRNLAPRSFLVDPDLWPDGGWGPAATPYARHARGLAVAVRDELAARGLSERGLARLARIPNNTLSRALRGLAVPDLVTVAALEECLGRRLLPDPGPGAPDV